MISKESLVKQTVESAFLVLSLIFPLHEISVEVRNNKPILVLKNETEERELNKENFPKFKEIISKMFNLDFGKGDKDKYNPSGSMAERIASKFKKREEQLRKLAKEQASNKQISILSRYASILAVGEQKKFK
jgi:hypothetical protein